MRSFPFYLHEPTSAAHALNGTQYYQSGAGASSRPLPARFANPIFAYLYPIPSAPGAPYNEWVGLEGIDRPYTHAGCICRSDQCCLKRS
jgi:hypothetical protein